MAKIRLSAGRLRRSQRGFTIIEFIIVVGIVAFLLWMVAQAVRTRRVTSGTFPTNPGQISLAAGGTGRFVWNLTQTIGGAPASGMPNRRTTFIVSPSPGAIINSITDAAGNPLAVNAATGTGVTDASGDVTIMITITTTGTFTLTATDVTTGRSEVASFRGVK